MNRKFFVSNWFKFFAGISIPFLLWGAVAMRGEEDGMLYFICYIVFIIIAVIAFIGSFFPVLILKDDVVEIPQLFRPSLLIKKEDIEKVTWAKGCPAMLILNGGAKVNLPDVLNSKSISNTIRAWLK